MKKTIKTLLIFALIMSLGTTYAFAFSDTQVHWAKETIEWGKEIGIAKGYPGGTFKPNNYVTEAEFLAMLIRAFEGSKQTQSGHWADGYYVFAKEKNYPTNGVNDVAKRSNFIDRTHVAEIVAGANGVNYTGDHAIHYLLAMGLAKGKVEGVISIESYKGSDLLTRAEAIQFIKNAKESGLTELKQRPFTPSRIEDLPPLPNHSQQPVVTDINDPRHPTYIYHRSLEQKVVDTLEVKDGKLTGTIVPLPDDRYFYSIYYNRINYDGTREQINFTFEPQGTTFSVDVGKEGAFFVGVRDKEDGGAGTGTTIIRIPSMEKIED